MEPPVPHPTRSALTRASGTLGVLALTAAIVAPTTGAGAAPGADPSCPAVERPADLADGEQVTGLTVTRGTEPEQFTGTYLGKLPGGIAKGVPMLMFDMAGSRITDGAGEVDAGIWAGMSGSPVYTDGGRLVGAVSYGLSWSPSSYAGVTPAGAMYDVLGPGVTAGTPASGTTSSGAATSGEPARRVDVPTRLQRQLTRAGVQRATTARWRQLPMPLAVSGQLGQRRLDRFRADAEVGVRMVPGGRTTAAAAGTDIVPGGNLAASLSYGDVTQAGTGTVTAVCGHRVLGFGHPLLWSGPSQLTMHGASALFIQPDRVFGSFKVSTPSGPVGAVTQDRKAAIAGATGRLPATASITSRTSAGHESVPGRTEVSVDDALAWTAALHTLVNGDAAYDGIRGGTSTMSWSITVERADGSETTIRRTDRFADGSDITYETPWSLYADLARIRRQGYEDVTVINVSTQTSYAERIRQAQLGRIEVRQGGRWNAVGQHERLHVHRGATLPLRVTLDPSPESDTGVHTVRTTARVPAGAPRRGSLVVEGGQSVYARPGGVQSFDQYAGFLAGQPPNNSVNATVYVRRDGAARPRTHTVTTGPVVRGGDYVALRIAR